MKKLAEDAMKNICGGGKWYQCLYQTGTFKNHPVYCAQMFFDTTNDKNKVTESAYTKYINHKFDKKHWG